MDQHRSAWNNRQKELQKALERPAEHDRAVALFLQQHAEVHSVFLEEDQLVDWSYEDEVWEGLSEETIRWMPPKGEHSIAWMYWHISRIEDMTMNLLVAGTPQVVDQDCWLNRMNVKVRDTGNTMDAATDAHLSASVDIPALRAYRCAVGRRTRQIVRQIDPGGFKQKAAPARLQQLLDQGDVADEARWLVEYWGGRTVAGLLLMPATRHLMVHLNEMQRIKQKRR